jgi:hypothetical protein
MQGRHCLRNMDNDERIILKWVLGKEGLGELIGLIWLRKGKVGRLL